MNLPFASLQGAALATLGRAMIATTATMNLFMGISSAPQPNLEMRRLEREGKALALAGRVPDRGAIAKPMIWPKAFQWEGRYHRRLAYKVARR
jgi:hypothetical protein